MSLSFNRRSMMFCATAGLVSHTALPSGAATPKPAPEFVGLENWLNSEPLKIQDLRGKTVLVDFWTFGCANCISTLPHLKSWYSEMSDQGLEIIGIHTPEFAFERELDGLKKAITRFEIPYPVVQDNKYQTWQAYTVRYWPTSVLVGRDGNIIMYHEGSAKLDAFGDKIRAALRGS